MGQLKGKHELQATWCLHRWQSEPQQTCCIIMQGNKQTSRFKKVLSTTTKFFCTKPMFYLILPIAPLYGCIVAKQQLENSKS